MHFEVITLFPELVENLANYGVVGRAMDEKLASMHSINPRDFTTDPNRRVDDRPYGGGPGMVMQFKPLQKAIHHAKSLKSVSEHVVICMSAHGKPLQHTDIKRLTTYPSLIIVAGRYEGIDERLMETEVDEEISIGDFVVSGGELPAMLMIDALIRHIPGALGHEESANQDSYVDGTLDCPHYTRPESVDGHEVPAVLLTGDHQAIEMWRKKQALGRTYERRPDLFAKLKLDAAQKALLQEYLREQDKELDD